MVEENSGKFFRFKLDFGLGFGFAEAYDFTDINAAEGNIVFIYNRIDEDIESSYALEEITSSGIALGPIRLISYPNHRGIGAWEYLFKWDSYIMEAPNTTKEAHDLTTLTLDWNTLKHWHKSDGNQKGIPAYVPYNEVRSLETRILNSTFGIAKKLIMKNLINAGKDVREYYDFSKLGNRKMFLQLINTYYPLEKTKELIELISTHVKNTV